MTAGSVRALLASACADVSTASAADTVGGKPARYVAAPASTQEAAAVLRAAAEGGLTVVARGSGTRLNWGPAPRSCDLIVDTNRLNQVLEHAAGDLVVSVQAGVTLGALADVLAPARQRLTLDPSDGGPGTGGATGTVTTGTVTTGTVTTGTVTTGSGTVGGVLATGVAGPLRFRFGAPRDLLIGITVVRADGAIARSGGKVVKNVAGYDLGKLFAGSYGTLGLITEATFRLHPLPTASAVITVECPDPQSAAATVQTMVGSPLAPSAIELHWPSAANPLAAAVLLEGDELSVAERADRMLSLLGEHAAVGAPALAVHEPASHDGTALRIAFWPGHLVEVLMAIRAAAASERLDPSIGGSAGAGVLHAVLPPRLAPDAVARFISVARASLGSLARQAGDGTAPMPPSTASAVVLYAPPEVAGAVDLWGPVPGLQLMRAVKDQFDPEHRMAPGRFAGGI